jgi:hypothetical protein
MEAADFSNPKANLIGHIVRMNCLLKRVIEGKLQGRIGMTGRWRRRRKELLNDLKEKRGSWNSSEETLDRAVWRTHFGSEYGPTRQTTEWMNYVNAERPCCTELYSINIGGFCTIKMQFVFDGCNSWSCCLQHNWMDYITIKQMS